MKLPLQKININQKNLIGLEVELTKNQDQNFNLIRNLWLKFNQELKKVKNRDRKNWEKFGVMIKGEDKLYYQAAVEKTDIMIAPTTLAKSEIPQGKYIYHEHKGSMYELKRTIDKLYNEFKVTNKTGLIHFEKYDHRFLWNKPDSIISIYLADHKI